MKQGRLNLRLDQSLITWAKDYSRRSELSVSELVRRLLEHEKEKDTEQPVHEAEQI